MHINAPRSAVIEFRQGAALRGVCALFALALAGAVAVGLAFTPPADGQGRPFYGVNQQGTIVSDDYNRMRNGRVGTSRFVLAWWLFEPRKGEYVRNRFDAVIGNLAARGIRALPVIDGVPSYLNRPPNRRAHRRAFRSLMIELAKRYGPGGDYWTRGDYRRQHPGARPLPVRTWQFFNEQNSSRHWGGRAAPRAYGRLVKMGANGLRSENRQAEVVIGGMFGNPGARRSMTSFRYLNRLYRVPGIRRAVDTVAVHPYAGNLPGIRRQMRRIRRTMRRNNQRNAQIRVTEIGWGADRGRHRMLKGPRGQARMLRRSFNLLGRHANRRKGWNVAGVNWWSWQDTPRGVPTCPFCHSSGLFAGPPNDRTPRRAWRAFRRAAR